MKHLIVLITLLAGLSVYGQNPATITLSSTDSGTKKYAAANNVKMTPGYKFSAATGKMKAYIEKNTVYQSLFSGTTFDGTTINTSLAVGTTNGSPDVSPIGSAGYSIPIPLPYGTNNLAPSLGLVYSSTGRNSELGKGWVLSGLSSISVTPKTFQQDGLSEAPNPNGTNNVFAMDGNRLYATSGTYGANGTIYGTEAETFVRITSYGSGSVPDWFKVETKDGLTMEFGNSADSRVKNATTGANLIWKITKTTDLFGNVVEYVYVSNDAEDSRIQTIKYSGNPTQNVPFSNIIEFTYQSRVDKNVTYYGGQGMSVNTLLSSIRITSETELFRQMDFEYGLNEVSYLKSVKETGFGGISYNPTYFKYGEENGIYVQTSTTVNETDVIARGDYDGDGLMDVVTRYTSGPLSFWRIMRSNGDGTFTQYRTGQIPDGSYQFWNSDIQDVSMPGAVSTFDFFGDGRDDLLLFSLNGSSGNYVLQQLVVVDIFDPIPGIPEGYKEVSVAVHVSGGYVHPNKFLHTGDFDGDGKDDLLVLRYSSPSNLTYFGKLIRSASNASQGGYKGSVGFSTTGYNVNLSSGLQALGAEMGYFWVRPTHFDGSGKQHLMVRLPATGIGGGRYYVFGLKKNGSTGDYSDEVLFYGGHSFAAPLQGDFNGDGISDVVERYEDELAFTYPEVDYCGINYGTGTGYKAVNFTNVFSFNLGMGDCFIADYNGDGRSDVFENYNSPYMSTPSAMRMLYSTGTSFAEQTLTAAPFVFIEGEAACGDFNGDGKAEVHRGSVLYSFNPFGQEMLLDKVKNGLGQETDFDYSMMTSADVYTKTSVNEDFPLNTFQTTLPLVKSVKNADGIGGQSTTLYAYEGAKLHRQGKGLLGFLKTTVTNVSTGKVAISENERFPLITGINTPLNKPFLLAPKTQTQKQLSDGSTISQTTYTNQLNDNNARYKLQVIGSSSNNYLATTSSTSTISYDAYGNITGSVTNNGIETTTTTNVPTTFGSWWIPSVMSSVKANTVRTGEAAYERKTNFTYTTKGKVYQAISDQATPKAVTVTYSYDNFGNNIQESTVASGNPTVITKTEYDAKGRFAVEHINALNQSHIFVPNRKWGLADSETDITGKTITNTYDGFGKLKTSTNPIGIATTINYAWSITSGGSGDDTPNNTLYRVTTITGVQPNSVSWYDKLGRVVQTYQDGLSGGRYTVTKFNANGTLASVTSPFFSGMTPIVTTHTYDAYQRPASVSNGVSTTTYGYSASSGQQTTTVSNPSGTMTQITDASGRVISSTDDGGTLVFNYYSSGNQKRILLNGDLVSSMEYDQYGRQTKLTNQNSGVTTYEYNAYGLLASQTDAEGQNYQITYDALGREISKTGPEGVTTYTYVTSGNGLNQSKKATSPNGVYTELFYDSNNRVNAIAKSVDGVVYTSSVEYDGFGRKSSLTYPSGFKIRYYYDGQSNLTSIKSDNGAITYYSAPQENEYGKLLQYTRGNGKTTYYDYTEYGNVMATFTSGVQQYGTDYNLATGNLNSRYDQMKNRQEIMTFDDLNRLTESRVGIPGNPLLISSQAADFDPNGNITDKTDAGAFEYDATKKNAVTKVTNPYGVIPTITQDIEYTPFDRPKNITEGVYRLDLTYGPEMDRIKTVLKQSGTIIKTKYFLDGYEREVTPAGTKEIHYINTPGGEVAYVVENGTGTYYYIYKDHLGTPVVVTNASGAIVAEQSFDAWGRRRNYNDWTNNSVQSLTAQFSWLKGFTGHEQLEEFGLINMNNRLYDPLLGRMLSVDNYVQNPFSTQSYNGYSYVGNNPVNYTDPSGEFASIIWQAGWTLGGTIANIINGVDNPFLTALNYSMSIMGQINAASTVDIYTKGNTSVNASINYMGLGVSLNFNSAIGNFQYGATVGLGVMSGAFYGANVGYNDGTTALNFGVGGGKNHFGWLASASVGGIGLAYGKTYYGNDIGVDGVSHKQTVGSAGLLFPRGSIIHQNDMAGLGDGEDRWRTGALEVQIGNFNAGFSIYTNDTKRDYQNQTDEDALTLDGRKHTQTYHNGKHGKHPELDGCPLGGWKNGEVFAANAWVGYSSGIFTAQIGFGHPQIQNKTQNALHLSNIKFAQTNTFNNYEHFQGGLFLYSGYQNPYSFWR